MQYKNDFKTDHKNKTIEFAGKVFYTYAQMKTVNDSIKVFHKDVFKDITFSDMKAGEQFKEFTKIFGITPSNFKRKFNAKMMELWIDPLDKSLKQNLYICFKYHPYIITDLHNSIEKVRVVRKDSQYNLIPLVALFNMTPAEFKKALGKSLWKSLCANSESRNYELVKKLVKEKPNYRLERLKQFQRIPSTFLKNESKCPCIFHKPEEMLNVIKEFGWTYKEVLENSAKIGRLYYDRSDCEKMAKQLGLEYNPKWSMRKISEKHEEYKHKINEKKYSKIPFESLSNIKVKSLSNDNFTATLLESAYDIYTEGQEMGHCVGMYSSYVDSGDYLVYSITDSEGNRVSTLGINRRSSGYSLQQHYGKYNQIVEDRDVALLAEQVVDRLMEKQKGKVFGTYN